MSTRRTAPAKAGTFFWGQLIVSALTGFLFMIALFFLLALVMVKGNLSADNAPVLAAAAACGGCFAAAYAAASRKEQSGLLCGFISFMAFALTLAAVGYLRGSHPLTNFSLLRAVFLLLSGSTGGFLGIRSAEKKHIRHMHRS